MTTSPRKTNLRTLTFWLLFIVVAGGSVGVGWGVFGNWPEQRVPAKSHSQPVPARRGVGAIGRLEPGWKLLQITTASVADGARLQSLLVDEGSEVNPGDVLAVLDTRERRVAALREAEAQVLVARGKLSLVKLGAKPDELLAQSAVIAQLKATFQSAEADLRRAEVLREKKVNTEADFDLERFEFEVARQKLLHAESTLAAMKTIRPEDVAVAEAELLKAEAVTARQAEELEATSIRAPIAGRVLKVHVRAGEKVGESGILELGNTAEMHAVAEVYERDIHRVKIGQTAAVWVQSSQTELSGEVVRVGWMIGRKSVLDNDPIKDTDARVVEVRIRLDAASSEQVTGLSHVRVEVRIEAPGDD